APNDGAAARGGAFAPARDAVRRARAVPGARQGGRRRTAAVRAARGRLPAGRGRRRHVGQARERPARETGRTTRMLGSNGPNLHLLGRREPDVYGNATLEDVERACEDAGRDLGVEVRCRQSNHEGALIDWLHAARGEGFRGVVLIPGGLTHTSV